MAKKLVIIGSASLQEKVQYWKKFWEDQGHCVIDYPSPINEEKILEEYPKVHAEFFRNIVKADILFIMNEDKNGTAGYLGAESFAEMCFGVAQNLIYNEADPALKAQGVRAMHNKKIVIILFKMPDKSVQSYNEIVLWLNLGWIKLYK